MASSECKDLVQQTIELENNGASLQETDNHNEDTSIASDVKRLHEQQLSNGDNNDTNLQQIVQIMGGIDRVLTDYLSSNTSHSLTTHQLQQIKQIIHASISPTKPEQEHQLKPKSANKTDPSDAATASTSKLIKSISSLLPRKDLEEHGNVTYTFYNEEKLMVSAFGERAANKISHVLHSWYVIALVVLLTLLWFVPYVMFGRYHRITRVTVVIGFIFFVPFNICWILEINKHALSLLLWSFDFWIKIFYVLMFVLFDGIREYHKDPHFDFTICIFGDVIVLLVIVVICSFDALNVRKTPKLSFCILTVIWFIFGWINYQFLTPEEFDHLIRIKAFNSSISCLSMVASSASIFSIFVAKQAFYTFYYQEQSVSIIYSPHIKWVQSRSESPR